MGESQGNGDVLSKDPARTYRALAAPILGIASALFQVERNAVHAPPLPTGLPRSVVEDVAEVRVAARAAHLCADHPVGTVLEELDGIRREGLGETRPPDRKSVV